VVLVVGPAPHPTELDLESALEALRKLVESGAKPRVAAHVVADLTGASANKLYKALTA
jgi:16S rRNA (cytidine1402-2'-O)-methyltransferase